MIKNKGFTLIELIVSFVLITVVSIALFKTVLNLQQDQKRNIAINNFKALTIALNYEIENDFLNDRITKVRDCGNNCYNITYKNRGLVKLSVNVDNNTITYGNTKQYLPEGYTLYDYISITRYISAIEGLNSYYLLKIPIKSVYDESLEGLKYMNEYTTDQTTYCSFDGEYTQGAEYVNGQYTYRYMQTYNGTEWENMDTDGWSVRLTDPTSTDPVTSRLCATVNGKPIVSMAYMFYNSQASSIDMSSFDTSNVTNMRMMFSNSATTSLDLSKFDTSDVINMYGMFKNSDATSLDLSKFDTSNVESMRHMFLNSDATSINLSSFNTSKVRDMLGMFDSCPVTSLDLRKFDVSSVTDMSGMFAFTRMSTIDLSSFDMTNVTTTTNMFNGADATTGYAWTQLDANVLNASSNKPSTLTFVPKS